MASKDGVSAISIILDDFFEPDFVFVAESFTKNLQRPGF